MSLVDQGMGPFQTAYPLVFALVFCVLAGNTCLVCIFFPDRPASADSHELTCSRYCASIIFSLTSADMIVVLNMTRSLRVFMYVHPFSSAMCDKNTDI